MSVKRNKDIVFYTKDYTTVFPYYLTVLYHPTYTAEEIWDKSTSEFPDLKSLSGSLKVPSAAEVARVGTSIYLVATNHITQSILIHESVHIVARIFDIINTDITSDTEEFFAYMVQYTTAHLLEIFQNEFKVKLKL